MSIQLKFMSAVVRKNVVESHYPGGCAAFESRHMLATEDDELYALFAMSGGELGERIDEIKASGFDADRFVAIGDMWHGPIRQAQGIRFHVEWTETIQATWYVEFDPEAGHD